jgi:copper homeostasis protein (lipoprotein)
MSTRPGPAHAIVIACAILGTARPSPALAANDATITGTATYRERVALTPDAELEATLEDVSRADAPAQVVARARRSNPGQVPISFTIPYDKDRIDARHRYVVRVSIVDGGRLRFVSDQAYPVLTGGHGRTVQVRMRAPGSGEEHGRPEEPSSPLAPLPATFTGVVPCSDCVGLRYQINLQPHGTFTQRTTHMKSGSDVSTYAMGRWSTDGRVLSLDPGTGKTDRWSSEGGRTLRKLNADGDPMEPIGAYDITRSASVEPLRPRTRMSGMFRYLADAPRFRECRTGVDLPVVMSGDYVSLERAYTEKRSGPGSELFVSLDGRIEQVPRMDGEGTEAALVVERFQRAEPGRACGEGGEGQAEGGLAYNRWVPVRIDGKAVAVSPQEREPWIHLDGREKQVTGSGGCNRFTGTYESGDASLRFGPLASTRMACASMETETTFFRALDRTRRYRVRGRTLELLDDRDQVLVQLEERNL